MKVPGLAPLCLAGVLAACAGGVPVPGTGPVPATAADSVRAEVRAGRAPACPLLGTAVHLGGGLFLTAAHIVDGTAARLRHCDGPETVPLVRYGGRDLPATVRRVGRGEIAAGVGLRYEGGADLALLDTRVASAGPSARPCRGGPDAGQPVIIESRLRTVVATAGGMMREVEPAYGTYAEVPLHMVPGESGAGVFDARSNCLLGIVSHREDTAPDTVRIVPSAAIRTFLGG
ncbi:trypsin-like peptidase domain-containing protein [Roseomonas sp. CCTCC AB2023176]|uniref:trypsin-like peptidase domain-containing protein n=1 Tax=Roseomonas sp. CCTCC AB2023176 TaxID=3342640 RepID=UPI0035D61E62